MKHRLIILFCCFALMTSGLIFAQEGSNYSNPKKITIGMIGKIGKNPVFIAAYSGARVAAKELGAKYKVEVYIDWQTPEEENVQEQASAIERLSRAGASGIAIACTDAKYLTPTINETVDRGIPVMCFDSDAPDSKRFAYFGANDIEFGKAIMRQLADEIKGRGTIAVLAGNKNALNQQLRLKGIKEELKNYPNISLPDENIYHNIEIPEPSAEMVRRAQRAKPNIVGWALQGSWAFAAKDPFPWTPGDVKIVAGNAVQNELVFVKSGYVQSLVGVSCFQYGYKSVEILLDKIINNRNPKETRMYITLTPVTKANVEEWSINWKKWLIKEAVSRSE